jgi:hypothetical protein
MSPARLSNYGPGRGPRARPMGRPGTARNSNRPGRTGRPECTPIVLFYAMVDALPILSTRPSTCAAVVSGVACA